MILAVSEVDYRTLVREATRSGRSDERDGVAAGPISGRWSHRSSSRRVSLTVVSQSSGNSRQSRLPGGRYPGGSPSP